MKKNKLVLILIFYLLFSCKTAQKEFDDICTIFHIETDNIEDSVLLSSYIDSIKIINLNIPETEILGEIKKVLLYGQTMYMFDKSSSIYIFDRQGNFLQKINHKGNGPGEYTRISDCFLNNNQIVVMDEALSKLLFYSLDGKYIEELKYKDIVRHIIPFNNNSFLCYTPDKMESNQHGLWIMNKNGDITKKILTFTNSYPEISSDWNRLYQTSNGSVGLFCGDRNETYYIKQDSIIAKYRFEIDKNTVESFPGKNSFSVINESFYAPVIQIDAGKWIWQIWGNPEENDTFFALHDKKQKQTKLFRNINYDVANIISMGHPIPCNIPDVSAEIVYSDELEMFSNSSNTTKETNYKTSLRLLHFSK